MHKKWFLINGFFAVMTILGFFYGFIWAKYISLGIGWLFSICSWVFFSKEVRYATIAKDQPMVNEILDIVFDLCIVLIFYYFGYLYLAGFYTAHMIILMQYQSDRRYFKKVGFKDPNFAKFKSN